MTNIVKVHPFPATKSFTNGFINEFFNRGLSDFIGNDTLLSQPATNVTENDDAFNLALAAPGFDKKDFVLNVENGHLTIEARHEEKNEVSGEKAERFLRREFRYESFKRSFKLPETINVDAIKAVYDNGVLKVELPKKEEAKPVSKTIKIG
ncbi:MAG: Hsp20/alpha crystallin family protein [Saprospiraceae bacterium]|nr:Hsp20/alpha crystallin family protein [Saprospiraceae bacterium]MCB9343043.1 Hsp20/alpha crystallin family protein [Lewinellaceae bacterium]